MQRMESRDEGVTAQRDTGRDDILMILALLGGVGTLAGIGMGVFAATRNKTEPKVVYVNEPVRPVTHA